KVDDLAVAVNGNAGDVMAEIPVPIDAYPADVPSCHPDSAAERLAFELDRSAGTAVDIVPVARACCRSRTCGSPSSAGSNKSGAVRVRPVPRCQAHLSGFAR